MTSGNSYTSWVAMQALEAACADQGVSLADRTIAVVGATGAIGHALSLLCAERAAELILIGNPQVADASVGRLRIVAQDCERHVRALAVTGRRLRSGCCGAPLRRRMPTRASLSPPTSISTCRGRMQC